MVVSPVDGDGDVILWFRARRADRLHHDLILLVAHDGHHLAVEALDDVGRNGRRALVCPKHLAVMCGDLRGPDVEVLVALRATRARRGQRATPADPPSTLRTADSGLKNRLVDSGEGIPTLDL